MLAISCSLGGFVVGIIFDRFLTRYSIWFDVSERHQLKLERDSQYIQVVGSTKKS